MSSPSAPSGPSEARKRILGPRQVRNRAGVSARSSSRAISSNPRQTDRRRAGLPGRKGSNGRPHPLEQLTAGEHGQVPRNRVKQPRAASSGARTRYSTRGAAVLPAAETRFVLARSTAFDRLVWLGGPESSATRALAPPPSMAAAYAGRGIRIDPSSPVASSPACARSKSAWAVGAATAGEAKPAQSNAGNSDQARERFRQGNSPQKCRAQQSSRRCARDSNRFERAENAKRTGGSFAEARSRIDLDARLRARSANLSHSRSGPLRSSAGNSVAQSSSERGQKAGSGESVSKRRASESSVG